jgi:hypothetical protein
MLSGNGGFRYSGLFHNRQFCCDPGIHAAAKIADIRVSQEVQVHHDNAAAMTGLAGHHDGRSLVGGQPGEVRRQIVDRQEDRAVDVTIGGFSASVRTSRMSGAVPLASSVFRSGALTVLNPSGRPVK